MANSQTGNDSRSNSRERPHDPSKPADAEKEGDGKEYSGQQTPRQPEPIETKQFVYGNTEAESIAPITISSSMLSALTSDTRFTMLSLANDNWPKWKEKIMEVMQMNDVDEYVTGGIEWPTTASSRKIWRSNNRKVLGFLKSQVEDGEKEYLSGDDATQAWDALLKCHEKQGPITQVRLIQDLLSNSYPEDVSSWATITDRMRNLCTRIFAQSIPAEDVFFMVAMLNALEAKHDHLRSEMTSYYVSNSSSSSAALENRIAQETLYKTRCTNKSSEIALVAQAQAKGRQPKICANCKRTTHTAETCWGAGGGMAGRKDEILAEKAKKREACTTATKMTPASSSVQHDQAGRAYIIDPVSKLALLLATPSSSPPSSNDTALSALHTDDVSETWRSSMTPADRFEYTSLICLDDLTTSINWAENFTSNIDNTAYSATAPNTNLRTKISDTRPFIMDSGASIHISPNASDFLDLSTIEPRSIKGVGGSSINAVGIGKIKLHISGNNVLILDPVLYVPHATVRLVSVKAIAQSQQLTTSFNATGCWITSLSGTTIATGTLAASRLGLFTLNLGSTLTEHAFIATRIPDLETWHRRLGHVNTQSIVNMLDKGMVQGMKIDLSSEPPKCQHCILGKQIRSSVPRKREGEKAKGILDIVHIDLTGPQATKSASGNAYIMSIIDDFSSYTWAIPLPDKTSAFANIKAWALAVERETNVTIGKLRLDNGELKSIAFAEFTAEKGITVEWTAPYTSSHAGRVERLHLTLFNSARTMRLYTGLPPNRWDEFVVTACYLHNRVPTKALKNMTLYEPFYKRKPNLSNLREIGSRAFVLIINKHNPKIYQRLEEYVLIGYGKDSKTYRCYHRATHKVVQSFHVVFIESKDDQPKDFRPGVMQGLIQDEHNVTLPNPNTETDVPAQKTHIGTDNLQEPSNKPPDNTSSDEEHENPISEDLDLDLGLQPPSSPAIPSTPIPQPTAQTEPR